MDTKDDDNVEDSEIVNIEFHIDQFQLLKTVGTGDCVDNDESHNYTEEISCF